MKIAFFDDKPLFKNLSKKFIAKQFLLFIFICLISLLAMLFSNPIKKATLKVRNLVYMHEEQRQIRLLVTNRDYSYNYAADIVRVNPDYRYRINKNPVIKAIDKISIWSIFAAKIVFFILIIIFFVIRPLFYATIKSYKILKA